MKYGHKLLASFQASLNIGKNRDGQSIVSFAMFNHKYE